MRLLRFWVFGVMAVAVAVVVAAGGCHWQMHMYLLK